MDKNALTEKRRETVIELLKGMQIKKGAKEGFDKNDVYDCVQKLCDLYERHIEELEKNYDAEIHNLTRRYQKYDENNELYVSLIMEAKKSSNEIINQAKAEVDNILKAGKEKIEKQEEEIDSLREEAGRRERELAENVHRMKDVMEAEKAAMRTDVEKEKEKLSAVKAKYSMQIGAMDEEFEEVRTNILRTATKLDSLRSKINEAASEDIQWDISNGREEAAAVEFPEPDLEVENIVRAEAAAPEGVREEAIFDEAPAGQVPDEDDAIADAPRQAVSVEELLEDISFDDLLAEAETPAAEPVQSVQPVQTEAAEEAIEEISIEDLMDVTGEAEGAGEHAFLKDALQEKAPAESFPPESAVTESAPQGEIEEISFDGLEKLFKDE